MAKKYYSLECEIVGGEISNPPSGRGCRIFVFPRTVFQPSEDLISDSKKFGIAVENCNQGSFSSGGNVIAIPFDEQSDCVKLHCSDVALAAQILACKGGRVVLELDDENNIVGFKAKF